MPELDAVSELIARSKDHPELRRFAMFHKANPQVLDFIYSEIRLLLDKGHTAYSFASLYNYCRWKLVLDKAPGERFVMNDHLVPFYSRALTILHPEINGHAEFRTSTADEVFGVGIEPGERRSKRLRWADGTPLESGWRPTTPHAVTRTLRRRADVHTRVA